jgi:hypothetical protein
MLGFSSKERAPGACLASSLPTPLKQLQPLYLFSILLQSCWCCCVAMPAAGACLACHQPPPSATSASNITAAAAAAAAAVNVLLLVQAPVWPATCHLLPQHHSRRSPSRQARAGNINTFNTCCCIVSVVALQVPAWHTLFAQPLVYPIRLRQRSCCCCWCCCCCRYC